MMFILFFSNWNRFNDTDTKRKAINIEFKCKSAKNKFYILLNINKDVHLHQISET
jgi:hypothetical protein